MNLCPNCVAVEVVGTGRQPKVPNGFLALVENEKPLSIHMLLKFSWRQSQKKWGPRVVLPREIVYFSKWSFSVLPTDPNSNTP